MLAVSEACGSMLQELLLEPCTFAARLKRQMQSLRIYAFYTRTSYLHTITLICPYTPVQNYATNLILMGVSENRGPWDSSPNSRILIIRTPRIGYP